MGKVDIRAGHGSFVSVRRFRTPFALFMAAFWLLATLHCELEAAGLLESHAVADQACCSGGEDHCSHDGCQLVENGGYALSAVAKVSSPHFAVCVDLICSSVSVPTVETVAGYPLDYFMHPLDWVPTWQFVQRTALSPRAPSLV